MRRVALRNHGRLFPGWLLVAVLGAAGCGGGAAGDAAVPAVSISSPSSGTTYTSAQTVTITASASDDVGVVRIELFDGSSLEGSDTRALYTYSWTLSAALNGTHSWTAKAYDAAGNSATSAAVSLTVAIDALAPSLPQGLSASASSCSQIDLSWSPSTDAGGSGLKGYKVYRAGAFLKQVPAPATSTSDTALNTATSYSYAVSAIDEAGNESAPSVAVSATTLADSAVTYIAPDTKVLFRQIAAGTTQYYYIIENNLEGNLNPLFVHLEDADQAGGFYNVDMIVRYSGAVCNCSFKPSLDDYAAMKAGAISNGQNGFYSAFSEDSFESVRINDNPSGCYYIMLHNADTTAEWINLYYSDLDSTN